MSSMVWDAYEMGITTSLGGGPRSSLFEENDYPSYVEDEDYEPTAEPVAKYSGNIFSLKLNIQKKRAVLHNDNNCCGQSGNVFHFANQDDFLEFKHENLYDYNFFDCPLCVEIEAEKNETQSDEEVSINFDEIPF